MSRSLAALDAVASAIKLEGTYEIYSYQAQLLYTLGQFQNALASIANAIHIEETGEMYYLEGQIYKELSQYSEAEVSFRKSLQLQDNTDVRDALIFVLAQQSKYSELELVKDNTTIDQHSNLGPDMDVHTTQIDFYETPTEIESSNKEYTNYYNHSVMSLRSKDYHVALEFILKALSAKETGSAYYIKGLILKDQGNYHQR